MAEAAARRNLRDAHVTRGSKQLLPRPGKPDLAQVLEGRPVDHVAEMLLQGATCHAAGGRELTDSPGTDWISFEKVERLLHIARKRMTGHGGAPAFKTSTQRRCGKR